MLLSALPAHADHRLLVTDVLDAGQFQAEADFAYTHSSNDFDSNVYVMDIKNGVLTPTILKVPGTETRNTFGSTYSLGAGLGHGFQVNVSIPYKFVDDINNSNSPGNEYRNPRDFWRPDSHWDGFGDVTTGLKYRIFAEEKLPLVVTAGLDVKFNTAGTIGDINRVVGMDYFLSGSTDISPCLAVSTAIGSDIKPYASYRATLRNNGNNDSHALSIGTQYEVSPSVTLNPSFSATLQTDSSVFHSYQSYDLICKPTCRLQKISIFFPTSVSLSILQPLRKDMILEWYTAI